MPVELAYKTYEVKNDKPDKSPLVIHHSLLGSKKNWKKVQCSRILLASDLDQIWSCESRIQYFILSLRYIFRLPRKSTT